MDVYATLAFVGERPSRAKCRPIKNDEATGILGFGFDLDVAGPGHKKNDLPQGIEDAEMLWKEAFPEWPATLWVNSGGGLHGYLLFDEAWNFGRGVERKRARTISRALSMRLKATAQHRGWTIDSVFDASRVLRVPGGYNWKLSGNPRPVRQLQIGHRYGLQELADAAEPFMEEAGQQGLVEKRSSSGQSFDASCAPEASEILLSQEEVERRIKLAVKRQGPEFWYHYANPQPTRSGGTSPSEYECRLVACARMDGWSRGEIKSLLHCFRVRRGLANPEKAFRDDYVDRTIAYVEQNQPDDPFETLEDSDAQSTAEEGDKISKSDGDLRMRLEKFFKTESGDAERLVALYGRNLLPFELAKDADLPSELLE